MKKLTQVHTTAPGLPELCMVYLGGNTPGERIGTIKRGEMGYYRSTYDDGRMTDAEAEALVDYINGKIGVTDAQAMAMTIGSMQGWGMPGADPALMARDLAKGRARIERKCLDYKG